jgi:hypothetical protein|nr:MAG TPA: hypothetical protein [Caudoviricetes sp.]DAV06990.1 MAG TPA: hypothetical protein [Caudoviricetes sp.]
MTRFCGKIGFGITGETSPGVYEDRIYEQLYFGDVTRNSRRLEVSDAINPNITVNNQISILADAYACDHFFDMKYVWWMGARWTISEVEVRRPRLILTLGGVYNDGHEATAP